MRLIHTIAFLLHAFIIAGQESLKFPDTVQPEIINKTIVTRVNSPSSGRYFNVKKELPPSDKIQRHEEESCKSRQGLLTCSGLRSLNLFWNEMNGSISSILIRESPLTTLNLDDFSNYPQLTEISVTSSGLTNLEGRLPSNIRFLNLSSNRLESIPESIFQSEDGNATNLSLEVIDISQNCLYELPQSLFELGKLKSLHLTGNTFHGDFVWDKLWSWTYENGSSSLLKNPDDVPVQWSTLSNGSSHCEKNSNFGKSTYSLEGCLEAKSDLVKTCEQVMENLGCECDLFGVQKDLGDDYGFSHKGKHGTISISINVDCSYKKLRELPKVPSTTWGLKITNNELRNLSGLKLPFYAHLKYLDVADNFIDIETLHDTPFLKNFMSLNLKNNQIRHFPSSILSAIKAVQERRDGGKGKIFLGGNNLDCDCDTLVNTLSILKSMPEVNQTDLISIFCSNIFKDNGNHKLLMNVKHFEVCIGEIDIDQQIWIWILIIGEVFLIVIIVAKVWYDQRRFRRTGELPWCSKKMPRLPCDTILEGLKKERRISMSTPSVVMGQSHHSVNNRHGSGASGTLLRVPKVRFMFSRTSRSNSDASHRTNVSNNSNSRVEEHGLESLSLLKINETHITG